MPITDSPVLSRSIQPEPGSINRYPAARNAWLFARPRQMKREAGSTRLQHACRAPGPHLQRHGKFLSSLTIGGVWVSNFSIQKLDDCPGYPAGLVENPAYSGLLRISQIRLGRAEMRQKNERVGAVGFEPTTSCSQSKCATRLRYAPVSGSDQLSLSRDQSSGEYSTLAAKGKPCKDVYAFALSATLRPRR